MGVNSTETSFSCILLLLCNACSVCVKFINAQVTGNILYKFEQNETTLWQLFLCDIIWNYIWVANLRGGSKIRGFVHHTFNWISYRWEGS